MLSDYLHYPSRGRRQPSTEEGVIDRDRPSATAALDLTHHVCPRSPCRPRRGSGRVKPTRKTRLRGSCRPQWLAPWEPGSWPAGSLAAIGQCWLQGSGATVLEVAPVEHCPWCGEAVETCR